MITRRDFIKVTAASGALATLGEVSHAAEQIGKAAKTPAFCKESGREIPVITTTDLVVVGGSSGAIAAAVAASQNGSKVFVVAPLPYLGDDICGSFMYQINKREEQPQTAMARKIYLLENDPREHYSAPSEEEFTHTQYKAPTPLHVKTVLENELIRNDIAFLYSSFVTNVLMDNRHQLAGVVIANRSGRQIIRCRGVIDTSTTAMVAEMCGIPFSEFKPGDQRFSYTVVGNQTKVAPGILQAEKLPFTFSSGGKEYPVTRYTFHFPLKDRSYASLMEAEQYIRDLTWDAEQVDSSDLLWYTPSYHILPASEEKTIGSLQDLEKKVFVPNIIHYDNDKYDKVYSAQLLPIEVFSGKGIPNLWVLGPCAAVPRDVASWLSRPINAMTLGEILGEHASSQIQEKETGPAVSVYTPERKAEYCGEIKELLQPLRPALHKEFFQTGETTLPVLGKYDVIVMGGGTAGAPAGISASMHHARTLVLEYLHGLGGLSTLGFIGVYWDGFREGYTAEIDKGVRGMAPADHPRQLKNAAKFRADWKMEWYRRQLRKNKAELWYGVIGCGALVHHNKVEGLVVATPFGRGVILADVIIDSTGSADIAIAAGAGYEYTGKQTLAVQGAGLPRFNLNDFYNNTDWTMVDDTDILDVSRLFVQGKVKYQGAYDLGKLPQTRERRRIIGDYTVSVYDVIHHKRYDDTISYHKSSFDTHGMTVDPFFTLNPPGKRHVIYDADVPLRALLPKGLEGIIVTGLGASAHRDAMPVIRMQPCLQNQGYSVGYLAATAVARHCSLRKVDIHQLQQHLVAKGILPERVLTDRETQEFSNKTFVTAAGQVTEKYKNLEILLTDPRRCIKVIRKQIGRSEGEARLIYASILSMLGEKGYTDLLVEAIHNYKVWDEGWHYTGSGQFGQCMSPLDSLIIALGNSRQSSALPVILEKARLLKQEDYFSHYRAVCLACGAIKDREAVPVLSQLLTAGGIRYHDLPSYRIAQNKVVPYVHDVTFRNRILKELHLAKSLYLCGDDHRLAEKTLTRYACGMEGHYARFAWELLEI